MVAALLRLVDAQSGAILVDGVDVSMVPLRQLRASIGVVSQQTFLFEGGALARVPRITASCGITGNSCTY